VRALVFLILGALLGSCSHPPPLLQQILRLGELRVVTTEGPATFYYGSDVPRGIEFELAQGFAARLGVDLSLVVADQPAACSPRSRAAAPTSPRARWRRARSRTS